MSLISHHAVSQSNRIGTLHFRLYLKICGCHPTLNPLGEHNFSWMNGGCFLVNEWWVVEGDMRDDSAEVLTCLQDNLKKTHFSPPISIHPWPRCIPPLRPCLVEFRVVLEGRRREGEGRGGVPIYVLPCMNPVNETYPTMPRTRHMSMAKLTLKWTTKPQRSLVGFSSDEWIRNVLWWHM